MARLCEALGVAQREVLHAPVAVVDEPPVSTGAGSSLCIVGSGPAGRGRLKKRGRHNRREGSGNDAPGRQTGVVGIHDSVYVVMPWCRES